VAQVPGLGIGLALRRRRTGKVAAP